MKNNIIVIAFLAVFFGLFSTSCETDSNSLPEIKTVELSADNKSATVTFSEAVYANSNATGVLGIDDLSITIPGVDAVYTVVHVAGEANVKINITLKAITSGDEVLEVKVNSNSVYDVDGDASEVQVAVKSGSLKKDTGIVGKWRSTGDNVAPILATYFKTDSIVAEFKTDKSYTVTEFRNGDVSQPTLYNGTYTIEKSETGEIWKIQIAQTAPGSAEVGGIFELKADGVLWYEVVLLTGTQNVPPTPTDGFGSTNRGIFGVTNIQKFVKY